MTITYGSVCSGIEAASVAWHPLGWRADWLAEIEPFPSAVLAHHYPNIPNLGDMTKIASKALNGSVAAPDILVGGTPCQAFSVAGMREGLTDPRGALTIKFVELADAIDHVRARRGKEPAIVVWENVPGVLSDKGNAFGCFLGALAGEDCELQPSGPRWTDAGCVYGPRRAIAWRVLDAQYFGLAQRRRRVFVVASARGEFDPAAVLFEREGMRRDTPPRRGEGQDVAGHAPFGPALQCGCGYLFPESLGPWGCPACEGEDGPGVSVLAGVPAFGGGNQGGSLFQGGTLLAKAQRGDFESETFCVSPMDSEAFVVAGTLQAGGKAAGSATQQDAEAGLLVVHGTQDPCVSDKAFALGRNSGQENAVLSVAMRGRDGSGTVEMGDEIAGCLRASTGGGDKPHALVHSAVRRLTPRECERLQGFPDDYTQIPWRGKSAEECPDGPRYKAIGNSKAVPVVRWIGRRIVKHLEDLQGTP